VSVHEAPEIRLINKVVVHFGYLPEDQAVTEVADHVRRFWDPRMRRRLLDLIDNEATEATEATEVAQGAQGAALEPVALAAAALLR
jgi:formate dehydrogenase subunit delta